MPNTYGKAETQKGKAETKTETENHKGKAETFLLAERLISKAENPEHDDLVEVVLTCFELQGRVYDLEKKFQDLIDNLRIFMVNEEEENAKK